MSITASAIKSYTNENKVRLTALFVLLIVVLYLRTKTIFLPFLLVIDFYFRSFNLSQFSPLGWLSGWIVKSFKLPVKPVFLPPKRFAARIGLLFSVAILFLHLFNMNVIIVSTILGLCAALEAFVGFCAGCYVYSFWQRIRNFE